MVVRGRPSTASVGQQPGFAAAADGAAGGGAERGRRRGGAGVPGAAGDRRGPSGRCGARILQIAALLHDTIHDTNAPGANIWHVCRSQTHAQCPATMYLLSKTVFSEACPAMESGLPRKLLRCGWPQSPVHLPSCLILIPASHHCSRPGRAGSAGVRDAAEGHQQPLDAGPGRPRAIPWRLRRRRLLSAVPGGYLVHRPRVRGRYLAPSLCMRAMHDRDARQPRARLCTPVALPGKTCPVAVWEGFHAEPQEL